MKLAVFYHCRLFDPDINPDFAITLLSDQMRTLKSSGLEAAAQEIVVCVHGGTQNQLAAMAFTPQRARFIDHGANATSLLPTVNRLREWCQSHKGWLVCFWHNKGVTHPGDELNLAWRRCMEHCVIVNWRRCVADLNLGYDTVGAHWLTPQRFHGVVKSPFWGGQFFWAKSDYLAELPAILEAPVTRDDWFLSERWIGTGRPPKVKDYAPHWPSLSDCYATYTQRTGPEIRH
jgi:hypothetical protein